MTATTCEDVPAASTHTLTARQVAWIKAEAKRRQLRSASALVRELIDHAIAEQDTRKDDVA